MSKEPKTAQINLRLPPSLKKAAERAASDDHRSLTSLIEKLLFEHLAGKGYLRSSGSDQGLRPDQLSSDNDG